MSGERGPNESKFQSGRMLPVIVVFVGAYLLYSAARSGTLSAVTLKPLNWIGLGLMVVGAVPALISKNLTWRLGGVLVCSTGAAMVFL